jgi:hypothetical protein
VAVMRGKVAVPDWLASGAIRDRLSVVVYSAVRVQGWAIWRRSPDTDVLEASDGAAQKSKMCFGPARNSPRGPTLRSGAGAALPGEVSCRWSEKVMNESILVALDVSGSDWCPAQVIDHPPRGTLLRFPATPPRVGRASGGRRARAAAHGHRRPSGPPGSASAISGRGSNASPPSLPIGWRETFPGESHPLVRERSEASAASFGISRNTSCYSASSCTSACHLTLSRTGGRRTIRAKLSPQKSCKSFGADSGLASIALLADVLQ